MTNLRTAFASLVVVLLVLGWGRAVMAAMNGEANEWARLVDGPQATPIRLLALVVLLAAIALGFVKEKEATP